MHGKRDESRMKSKEEEERLGERKKMRGMWRRERREQRLEIRSRIKEEGSLDYKYFPRVKSHVYKFNDLVQPTLPFQWVQ